MRVPASTAASFRELLLALIKFMEANTLFQKSVFLIYKELHKLFTIN